MKEYEIICESEEGLIALFLIKAANKQAAIRELAKRSPEDAAAVLEINEV